MWSGVGKEEGMKIWRIVKFKVNLAHVSHLVCYDLYFIIHLKVTEWPEDDYGKFHEADAYIVLNSHRIHEMTRVCC